MDNFLHISSQRFPAAFRNLLRWVLVDFGNSFMKALVAFRKINKLGSFLIGGILKSILNITVHVITK
jgi:hypothetical protein